MATQDSSLCFGSESKCSSRLPTRDTDLLIEFVQSCVDSLQSSTLDDECKSSCIVAMIVAVRGAPARELEVERGIPDGTRRFMLEYLSQAAIEAGLAGCVYRALLEPGFNKVAPPTELLEHLKQV